MGIKWEDRTIAEKICIVCGGCFLCVAFISLFVEFGLGRFPLFFWFCLSCANLLLGIVNLSLLRVLGIVTIVIHVLAAMVFGWILLLQIL